MATRSNAAGTEGPLSSLKPRSNLYTLKELGIAILIQLRDLTLDQQTPNLGIEFGSRCSFVHSSHLRRTDNLDRRTHDLNRM